jgi:hypothetical protein
MSTTPSKPALVKQQALKSFFAQLDADRDVRAAPHCAALALALACV